MKNENFFLQIVLLAKKIMLLSFAMCIWSSAFSANGDVISELQPCPLFASAADAPSTPEGFGVFPNPVQTGSELQLQIPLSPLEQKTATVSIYSTSGRFIRTERLTGGFIAAPSAPGMFFVVLRNANRVYGSRMIAVR